MQVSIYCPFCHRHTSLEPARKEVKIALETGWTGCVWHKSENEFWWIGVCNYCSNPVLVRNRGEVIFPHPLPSPSDDRIPENIRKDLNEAKMCFSVKAYRACAVMARRAMQNTCIEKKALKGKLADQMDELANKGIITKGIKDWADVVRWVGNDAAHPDKKSVTKESAKDVLELTEQFLHVIYVAPAIAGARKGKRNTRKTSLKT